MTFWQQCLVLFYRDTGYTGIMEEKTETIIMGHLGVI